MLRELRDFFREVDAIEKQILSGKEPEGCPMDPIVDGETVVGVLDDSWLKALFLAQRKRREALAKEFLELQSLGSWGFFKNLDRMAEFSSKRLEIEVLSDLVTAELRISLDVPNVDIEIRQGWKLVAQKEAETPEEAPRPRSIFRTVRAGCSDLRCPVHPPKGQA